MNLRSIIELYARPMGPRLFLLLGAVTSLLLIGCANVSILLLVRGAHRQQELAVRAALGAGRGRIVRQLLTEALAIAVAGAALGILIAWKGLALIVAWMPTNSFAVRVGHRDELPVLLFSTALAVVTAIVFGVWPALQLSRPDLGRVAQASTRRVMGSAQGRRVHRVMVAVQVALTLLMLTAAGAAGKGFLRLVNADLGYDPQQHDVAADSRPRRHLPDVEGAVRVLRAAPRDGRGDAAGGRRPGSRPTPRRRRTAATARSRFSGTARSRSRSPGPISSAPSTFRSCAFRSRRDASGTATRPSAARRSR